MEDLDANVKKLKIVATTTQLADMVKQIAGDTVEVSSLMGAGIDPHLYKPSAGDYESLDSADMIVYNGLNLEGKLGSVIEHLSEEGKEIVLISKGLSEDKLLIEEEHHHEHDEDHSYDEDEGHEDEHNHDHNEDEGHNEEEHEHNDEHNEEHHHNEYDAHIWFDAMLWKEASKNLYDALVKIAPENKNLYEENYEAFKKSLDDIYAYAKEQIALIPEESRVLVTAHHAFSYFGNAYGIEVKGLQGISTSAEAGTKDVAELADFIAERKIKAIFVESNVPIKNIEALQEAVKARGFEVTIGGELYSDSLGSDESTNTYVGMLKTNIDTIVSALK